MGLKLYQVDAFTSKLFAGNPAAVCPLSEWPSDELMQKIAFENNQSETAFFVKQGNMHFIRWFTPMCEVDLCGHATLASAFILFNHEGCMEKEIFFNTRNSGQLRVRKEGDYITLNFPADTLAETDLSDDLLCGFEIEPIKAFRGLSDYMLIFETEEQVRSLRPEFGKIRNIPARGVIVTAPGENSDFVSRFFGPQSGIDEDPVTGSAHTTLIPYWNSRLNKPAMTAIQVSSRSGFLKCRYLGDRVEISGQAILYMKGDINVNGSE
jgi:PhzF family phenazine biosynthesis protein